ncbi:unnamed protein product [Clavelina lepadiformis]|uniref:Uncharacterized protein n=1 Tax=Clavelina lepadiformis TaxID=159417 RepID=A0ABP0FZT5_CLALP
MRFNVEIKSVNQNGFECTAEREDKKKGWSQNPCLHWNVDGAQVAPAQGSREVGSSEDNKVSIHVDLNRSYSKRPEIFAWVRGDPKYEDRFTVKMDNVNLDGFDCVVQRSDKKCGWGQNPKDH